MKELIQKIKDYYCHLKSPKRYWYEVKYVYRKCNSGEIVFDYKSVVGLIRQNTVLDKRALKKITTSLHMQENTKQFLYNGVFDVEVICYLGKMKRNDKLD